VRCIAVAGGPAFFDTLPPERLNDGAVMRTLTTQQSNMAVFLDREGVITPKLPRGVHVVTLDQAVLAPGAADALRLLTEAGCRLFIVTNQSGVARGYLTRGAADAVHAHIVRQLADRGVVINDSRLCPHRDEDGCACRKPKPGMIADLCDQHGIDPARAALIGDSPSDVVAGLAAGCAVRVHLALSGQASNAATHRADNLLEAVRIILEVRYD